MCRRYFVAEMSLALCLQSAVALAADPAPLSTFKDCPACPEMVVLPPGKFMMGASADDRKLADSYSIQSELPQHAVEIGYVLAIGRFEVTVEEFAAFVQETGTKTGGECEIRTPDFGANKFKFVGTPKPGPNPHAGYGLRVVTDADFRTPGARVTDRHPASCISRREAKAYLEWLSKKSGKPYRFPTEAEWEYAVRAGSVTAFHFGNSAAELCRYGNFADRASPYNAKMVAKCAESPSPEATAPVGSYRANAWGLHDMIGNVFEFTEDCASPNYQGAPNDGSPRRGPCDMFATRGYFFDSIDVTLRSAARCPASDWDSRSNAVGLRVAVSLSQTAWDRRR